MNHLLSNMFHRPLSLFLKVIVLLVLIIVLSNCRWFGNDNDENNFADCTSGFLFTALPLALTDFTDLAPLGNLNPTGHTLPTAHHYFYIVNSDSVGAPDVVDVHMPGDAWITSINTSTHLSANPVYVDYSISFKPCSQYRAYFGHIQTITTDLQTLLNNTTPNNCNTYTTGGNEYQNCSYNMSHFVAAGTVIGTTGGTVGQWALDFGARDQRIPPLQWANQTRWENGAGDAIYTACISDAYEPTLKVQLEARFGYNGNPRLISPVCGTIEQDIPGTAQGAWFLATAGANNIYPEDPHVALVHDNFDPAKGVLSIGNSISAASGAHQFIPTSIGQINREFSEITGSDSNIYCYPLSNGALLLQMTSNSSLQLEHQTIDCTTDTPYSQTGNAVSFIR